MIKLFSAAGEKIGHAIHMVEDHVHMKCIKMAEIVSLEEKKLKFLLGNWPKDPVQKQVGSAMYVFTVIIGWDEEDA
ncbi:uncharacterized protein CTHT_0004410 [Thermochaetoides thermophila DSM 1495]|uniref:Uncharacterized protein n=1 Tax=Chaetomium thermophilum (strain DSM 1495 / CBS 144.50 / IMI 039719) TaxID=759272 RepID=G0RZW1_CHATD|nr:hypothetical protein CTHT_0004410 [Thermochaetoides thermophila DSM 1495]EGS23739.1 hypothetical protein CTHT_0004410 [Thermochaetoides thermophila DSM 1495]